MTIEFSHPSFRFYFKILHLFHILSNSHFSRHPNAASAVVGIAGRGILGDDYHLGVRFSVQY